MPCWDCTRLALLGLVLVVVVLHTVNALPDHHQDVGASVAVGDEPNISFQLHSIDDLDEWPQILRKGPTKSRRYIKIDMHYTTPSVCATQQRVKNPTDPRGCFLLVHDPPSPTLRRDYNTSHDIEAIIADPTLSKWAGPNGFGLTIALCFKYPDQQSPCDGTETARNWLSLLDELFALYNQVVAKFSLKVEFVMDGAATPGGKRDCLKDRWRPWTSTYISNRDSLFALFSDDVSKGYDRFQWLNEPAPGEFPALFIELLRMVDYGKFRKSLNPFQVWEPSDQDQIWKVADAYNAGPSHPPGFRFSINIDPVMFEVFVANRSNYGWNVHLVPHGSAPRVAALPLTSRPGVAVLTICVLDVTGLLGYQLSLTPEILGKLTQVRTEKLPFADVALRGAPLVSQTDKLVLVCDSTGRYNVYGLDEVAMRIVPLRSGAFPLSSALLDVYLYNDNKFTFSLTVQKDPRDNCSVNIQYFALSTADPGQSQKQQQYFQPTGSVAQLRMPYPVANASIALHGQGGWFPATKCPSTSLEGLVFVSTTNEQIFGALVCVDPVSGNISTLLPDAVQPLGVGRVPSVSIAGDAVLVVHSDGFCDNAHLHNIRNFPAVCRQTKQSTPLVLQYSFGHYRDLVSAVLSPTLLTSCSRSILHGTFDKGSSANAHLFRFNSQLGVVSVHEGVPTSVGPHQPDVCGSAIPFDGVVLDSWALPDL